MDFASIYKRFNEAKQVGIIYHLTDRDGFNGIIEKDRFGKSIDKNKGTTSFTRNKRFGSIPGNRKRIFARFTVDGNKLSEHHHIEPHADNSYFYRDSDVHFRRYEAEERVFGRVDEAGKYITKIEVFSSLSNLRDIFYPSEKYKLYKFIQKYPHIETSIDFSDFIGLKTVDNEISGIYKNGKLIYSNIGHSEKENEKKIIELFNLEDKLDEDELQELFLDGAIQDIFPSYYLNGYDLVWIDAPNCRIYVRTNNIDDYKWLEKYNSEIVHMPYKLQFEDYDYENDESFDL